MITVFAHILDLFFLFGKASLPLKWTYCAQGQLYLSWKQYDVHQELTCLMKSADTLHASPAGCLQLSPPEGGWGEALKGLSEVLIVQICKSESLDFSKTAESKKAITSLNTRLQSCHCSCCAECWHGLPSRAAGSGLVACILLFLWQHCLGQE